MSTCIPCMDGNHRECRYKMCRDCVCQCAWGRNGVPANEESDPLARAEERLRLAQKALIADGYFTADEVGDDVAPRISELSSHLRHRIENLENRLGCGATSLYWECATCMDGQRSYYLTRPCVDGSESVECESCGEPMRLMMTHSASVPDIAATAVLAAADFKRRLRHLTTTSGYSKAELDRVAAGIMNLAQPDP